MSAELQRLVDALAERTKRPTVLEDRRQRMIVYSRHDEPLDRVRTETILRRRTTPEIIAWLRQYGISEVPHAVRTPEAPHLGLLPRVCVPLRHHGMLLGFLWFVDADASMSDEDIAIADAAAEDFALALYRENLAEELASNREAEAIRNLLVSESRVQSHAAQELLEGGQFHQHGAVTALVALPVLAPGATDPDDLLRLAIEQALIDTRRRAGPRRTLHLVRYDHGLLLVADANEAEARDLGEVVRGSLEQTARGLEGVERIVVGVGGAREHLARARESYEHARQAASAAVHLPTIGAVAQWSRLGVYRALVQLSSDEVRTATLHEGLDRLLDDPAHGPLVDTLEAYLDLAGNVQATSTHLNLHRTSLYYRLQRIEDIAETDLRDGNERLVLHLGLKLARLSGRR